MISLNKTFLTITLALVLSTGLAACSPEVGSKEWCEELKKKDKGQWTGYEANEFTKSCIL